MSSTASSWRFQAGYTLIEIVVVVGIIITGAAVAIPVTIRMVNNARGDSSVVMTATFLRTARNRAVAERRNIVVTFPTENTIEASRVDVTDGTLTVVDTMSLEGEQKFIREGLPDTPDRFGGGAAINFSGPEPVMFTSDGSLIDNVGDVTNGTIYVARAGNLDTARAVTIWGVTGLMRSWRWQGGTEWSQ